MDAEFIVQGQVVIAHRRATYCASRRIKVGFSRMKRRAALRAGESPSSEELKGTSESSASVTTCASAPVGAPILKVFGNGKDSLLLDGAEQFQGFQ